jgi:hypothetical protein
MGKAPTVDICDVPDKAYGPCPVCGGSEFLTFSSIARNLPYENKNGICRACYWKDRPSSDEKGA